MSLTCYKVTVHVALRPSHLQKRNLSQQASSHSDNWTNFFSWTLVNPQKWIHRYYSLNFVGRLVSNTVSKTTSQIYYKSDQNYVIVQICNSKYTTNKNAKRHRWMMCSIMKRLAPFCSQIGIIFKYSLLLLQSQRSKVKLQWSALYSEGIVCHFALSNKKAGGRGTCHAFFLQINCGDFCLRESYH